MINDALCCKSCKETFNEAEYFPFVVECGHTFCFCCLFQSRLMVEDTSHLNLCNENQLVCPLDNMMIDNRLAIKNLIVLEILKCTENGCTNGTEVSPQKYIRHKNGSISSNRDVESNVPTESYRKPSVRLSTKRQDNASPGQFSKAKKSDPQSNSRNNQIFESKIPETEFSKESSNNNNLRSKSINRSQSNQKIEENNTPREDPTKLVRTTSNIAAKSNSPSKQLTNESTIKPGLSTYLRSLNHNKSEKNSERYSLPTRSAREPSAIGLRNDSKKRVSLNDKGRVNVGIVQEQALKVDLFNNFNDSSNRVRESEGNVGYQMSIQATKRANDDSIDTIPLLEDKSIIDQSFREDCNNLFYKDNGKSNQIKSKGEAYEEARLPNTMSSANNELKIDEYIKEYLISSKRKIIKDANKELGSDKQIRLAYLQHIDTAISSRFMASFTQSIKDKLSSSKVSLIHRITRNNSFFVGFKIHSNTSTNFQKEGLRQILSIRNSLGSNFTLTGCLFSENGDYYEGSLDNMEAKFGKGYLCYSNGITYEGQFLNGLQHGVGKLCQPDGEIYIGEWKEGKINGVGSRFHSNGDKYDGNYVNNIRSGYGEYTFSNGDKYAGTWENGKASGKGKFMFVNGNFYEGDFQANQILGKGCMHMTNGDLFRGDFVNGKLNGNGYWKSINGSTYKGEFINGKKHGFGIFYDSEQGSTFNGQWIEDKYVGSSSSSSNKKFHGSLNYH